MILPSKHLSQERALLSVGAKILRHLHTPKTVSAVWEDISKTDNTGTAASTGFDSFILALDLLYSMNAVDMEDGVLSVVGHD